MVININKITETIKTDLIKQITRTSTNIKYTPNTLTLFPLNQNALEKAKELITKYKLEYHSYTENSKKDKKLVIKGLPPLDIQEIEENMKKQGITPKKLTKLKHAKANEYPIYYLAVEPTENLAEIKKIRSICNIKIRWENYKNPRKITQCYRCQNMGHGSGNCHHDPKCLKCGEGHLTKECIKPRDTPAKCANCKGPHPANSTTCKYYKRHLTKVMNNRKKNTTNAAIARTTIELAKTQFPPLLKSNNTAQNRTKFGQGGQEETKPSDPHPIQLNYGFNRQLASTDHPPLKTTRHKAHTYHRIQTTQKR